jgi:hypothetical protein
MFVTAWLHGCNMDAARSALARAKAKMNWHAGHNKISIHDVAEEERILIRTWLMRVGNSLSPVL